VNSVFAMRGGGRESYAAHAAARPADARKKHQANGSQGCEQAHHVRSGPSVGMSRAMARWAPQSGVGRISPDCTEGVTFMHRTRAAASVFADPSANPEFLVKATWPVVTAWRCARSCNIGSFCASLSTGWRSRLSQSGRRLDR